MKKNLLLFLSLVLLLSGSTFLPATVQAAASSISIAEVSYKGKGRVEVDFRKDVVYKNTKVTVKDSAGKSYSVKINAKDDDDIKFTISNFKKGSKYTFKISGIKNRAAASYTSVSSTFSISSSPKATIKKLEYDSEDKELSIDFKSWVNYSNPKVTVKDSSGKSYSATIIEKDRDDMELRVNGLKSGSKYTLSISGIKHADATTYSTISKSFTAF